ncbi:hypothetical protein DIZ27_32945 [Streptomyces sp. NWU339]|uniref:hypothetical protein n=1 Tax=Streptomyces sp. NWU339 TaxID=2185284 RepID=UPI000D676550|nr:hypothetical protein [Streptomyces sp. NWU339]PWI06547.1 hypothetical protein DIZ27_32945 [Streptomyces sp. NWU339]
MGGSETAPLDIETIRKDCQRALWEPPVSSRDETRLLVERIEGHARLLGPVLAACAPRIQGEMKDTALVVLRNVDEVRDERAPAWDLSARLHDLGVVTRSLLNLLELAGEIEQGAAR